MTSKTKGWEKTTARHLFGEEIDELLTQTQQETLEMILKEVRSAWKQDFPRGERPWCRVCASRIFKTIKKKLNNLNKP